jgi:CBS domain containing-hemolysin-like protein
MRQFLRTGVSRIPIVGEEADEVLGMVYLRDLAKLSFEAPGGGAERPVTEFARPALFVPESKKADSLLRQMQRESNHLAMVVDEYGGIAGLVTLEDLIEELVGDISDEYDKETPQVEPLGDERFRVSARLPVDELGELFDLELEDEDVDTVGGLLAKAVGRLPVEGSTARYGELVLTADRMDGRRRRISTVVVARDPGTSASAPSGAKRSKGHAS